jgi:hypothetical protein
MLSDFAIAFSVFACLIWLIRCMNLAEDDTAQTVQVPSKMRLRAFAGVKPRRH